MKSSAQPTEPTCTSCNVKLTQLDLDGSLSELGLTAYEAICSHCYAVEVEN